MNSWNDHKWLQPWIASIGGTCKLSRPCTSMCSAAAAGRYPSSTRSLLQFRTCSSLKRNSCCNCVCWQIILAVSAVHANLLQAHHRLQGAVLPDAQQASSMRQMGTGAGVCKGEGGGITAQDRILHCVQCWPASHMLSSEQSSRPVWLMPAIAYSCMQVSLLC
jgi:hypothetical protein